MKIKVTCDKRYTKQNSLFHLELLDRGGLFIVEIGGIITMRN
jgi:hypothetical protein